MEHGYRLLAPLPGCDVDDFAFCFDERPPGGRVAADNVSAAAHNALMTRYAIDAATAIRIVREGVVVHPSHQLVAPKSLHSDALSTLYREVRGGGLGEREARGILDGITTMKIRLLGDRVSRATAWKVATRLDWNDTARAEYVAVAELQADAFVTVDTAFATELDGVVPLAPFEALGRATG